MKRLIAVVTLAFALVLGGCGSGLDGITSLDTTNDDYKFDGLQQQINGLQTQIDGLQAQLNAIEPGASAETISAINASILALQNQLRDLSKELADLKKQVGIDNVAIDLRLKALEGAVKDLKTAVGDLNTRIGVLERLAKPSANPPMFVSAVVGNTTEEENGKRGATIRWTGSAGGGAVVSYNVWAVTVDKDGFFGVPVKLANGTGSSYYWNGHTDSLPGLFTGTNPSPLYPSVQCSESEKPAKYRFAVTAIDGQGRESGPSVTADEFIVLATINQNPS
jgi:TolA-binding protein